MTIHVFIVDYNTFKYHLNYQFVGTSKTLKLKYIEHFVSKNQLIFEEVGY